MRIPSFLAILSLLFVTSGCASNKISSGASPQRMLLILSKVERTLSFVDVSTFKIINRVPVGPDPHEVIVSSDGKTAYVSNTGSGRFHEINVIDILNQRALPNIDTESLIGPHGMVFVGDKLWFTAEGAKSIGRYDPKLSKIDWAMGVGQNRTHMIYVTKDEKQIYTTNVDSGTISLFENLLLPPPIPPIGAPLPGAKAQMGWLQTVIPIGKGTEGLDASPDEKELWTASAHDGKVSIVDLTNRKVIQEIDSKTLGISRVRFTPDGKRVLVTSLRTGDLLIYDARTRKEIKKINLGKGAAHILIGPQSEIAFISCTPANYVSVVDLKKLEVMGHLDVGGRPDGMDWASL